MPLITGVEETYYKNFVLTEDGLKEFHKMMENAAQRFPAPAELIYTVVHSDFRYFQTKRLEDVTHDMEVQKKNIIQLTMEAQFIDQNAHIDGNLVSPPPEEWNIRVVFNILQKGFWDTRSDRINLRVKSEDRKWSSDYIDRFEELIYNIPRGERTPTTIFWLFIIPLIFLTKTFVTQIISPAAWFLQILERYAFFLFCLIAAAAALIGVAVDLFEYRPYAYRILFGPDSSFVWGQGKVDHEAREYARQISMWVVGGIFIFLLFISVQYAIR